MGVVYLSRPAGDSIEPRSAGSATADSVNPNVIEATLEEDVDLRSQKSARNILTRN